MKRALVVGYVALVHLLLLGFFVRSDTFERLTGGGDRLEDRYRDSVTFHQRQLGHMPPGFVAFLGDSHVEGLAVSAVASRALNLGIGGDTARRMPERIRRYSGLGRAEVLVVEIGSNDLSVREVDEVLSDCRTILDLLPPELPLLWCTVPPIGATATEWSRETRRIRLFNEGLVDLCAERKRCVRVDLFGLLADADGSLPSRFDSGDGVHLSPSAYDAWVQLLQSTIDEQRLASPGP